MPKPKVNYNVLKRVQHEVTDSYTIVFDRCNPIHNGVVQNYEQLSMRYIKNGKTVNNAPSFNETDMMRTIVKLYHSKGVISEEAKEILRDGIK